MDVLPLVPVGSLVLVVAWLIWPVFQDALFAPVSSDDADFGSDDLPDELFDTWTTHTDAARQVQRKHAA